MIWKKKKHGRSVPDRRKAVKMGTTIGGGKFQRHEMVWQVWGEVAGDENERLESYTLREGNLNVISKATI